MEIHEVLNAMQEGLERMHAAATMMEQTAETLVQAGSAQKIVATAESERELELERKLEAAERQIAELRAESVQMAERTATARKTLPSATTQLLAKQGLTSLDSIEAAPGGAGPPGSSP